MSNYYLGAPKIYLGGQISGLTQKEAVENWRSTARARLEPYFEVLCPMRHTSPLKEMGVLAQEGYPDDHMASARGITTRDRFDVQRCDLVLCNLIGATRVSKGSLIEFGWADAWRKPVILCAEVDNEHATHAMVKEIVSFIVPSLDDGIKVALEMF